MIKILKGTAENDANIICRQNECREKSLKETLNFNSSGGAIGKDNGKEQMIRAQTFLLPSSSASYIVVVYYYYHYYDSNLYS